jgi:hypothetical protein
LYLVPEVSTGNYCVQKWYYPAMWKAHFIIQVFFLGDMYPEIRSVFTKKNIRIWLCVQVVQSG